MPDRRLPAHIEAALKGNQTDSAGQPWAGRDLSGEGNPLHAFDDDDGGVPASYDAAVSLFVAGQSDESAVVNALSAVRVFVPVIAELAGMDGNAGPEPGDHGHGGGHGHAGGHGHGSDLGPAGDKEADMALITIKAPDGRSALPVFTSTERLKRWHADARPVAVFAPRAALSAVAEKAELMVVDPGAEVTFAVRRPALWALAQQTEWTPSYADSGLAEIIAQAVDGNTRIRRVEVGPGSGVSSRTAGGKVFGGGGPGPELRLTLVLEEDLSREEVTSTVQDLQNRLRNLQEFVERVDSLEIRLTRS